MEDFRLGAVLKVQREHTWKDIGEMLAMMKEKGLNTVVVWPAVYWWEDKSLENYPFQTGHEILKFADELGLKIVMELAGQITSLEYAPDFLMKDEYYALDRKGNKNTSGLGYGYLNFNHPEVRGLIQNQYKEIAEQYQSYKSLYGYDIWNETMFTSFDSYTLELFREWLKGKYSDIESLNNAWDRAYGDWSQVGFATWLWASVMPLVDYEQFHKDNIGMILSYMRSAIKSVDKSHPVIADNIFSMTTMDEFYDRPQDDWNVARNVDIYGMDFYPKFFGQVLPPFFRWQTLMGASSASPSKKFWVSELQTHHTAMFLPHSYCHPNELKTWAWEAVSQGAKGIVFWKWNPFDKGVQLFGRGLVNVKGESTPRADAVAAVSKVIFASPKEFEAYVPETPRVAILYDRMNQDFVKALTRPYEAILSTPSRIYTDCIAGLYKCLWDENIPAKYISPEDVQSGEINSYKALFVSNQVCIDEAMAAGLMRFAESGGIIITDGKFGEIARNGLLWRQIPGLISPSAGFELLDMQADQLNFSMCEPSENINFTGYYEHRELRTLSSEAEVLAMFENGEPAIVRSNYKKGAFIHIATFFWYGYLKGVTQAHQFMKRLNAQYMLSTVEAEDPRLKTNVLRGADGCLLFVFNYTGDEITSKVTIRMENANDCKITDLISRTSVISAVADGLVQVNVCIPADDIAIYTIGSIDS